jgi:hypothetical protein
MLVSAIAALAGCALFDGASFTVPAFALAFVGGAFLTMPAGKTHRCADP